MVNVVIVCTSASQMGAVPTGVWIEEAAAPYYMMKAAGYEVSFASPAGGAIPIDGGSMAEGFFTDAAKKFMHDSAAFGAMCHSTKLADVKLDAVDGLYFAGGHGTCVDYINNPVLTAAIEKFYAESKSLAFCCHGPIALADCKKPDGTPMVAGLSCTGFTDAEEAAVGLTDAVPFLIETRFKEQGGLFEKVADWNPKACTAGKLVTGQNPQSSEVCAEAFIALLK
jgi:putative intracellular protease/amidase